MQTQDPTPISRTVRLWRSGWMLVAGIAAVVIVGMLVRPSRSHEAGAAVRSHSLRSPEDLVGVDESGLILVKPDTPLARNLEVISVIKQVTNVARLKVTGSIVARIRPGTEPLAERWQFASADVASGYVDWVKSQADIEFNRQRLATTRELTQSQIDRFQATVDRLLPLAPQGGIAGKDLRMAEADLVQAKLQGQKDVFEAETAVRAAERQKTALERQLAQAGIEPIVFSRARDGMVLVSANVPESKISLVKHGQPCDVIFYGFPGKIFSAHVEELGSVLSTERRTLRVLFDLTDLDGELKPGMFAEVGLGTDTREVLLVPANAIVHLGRNDYVFRQTADGQHFAVVEVQISESRGDQVEVLKGLQPGDRIAGNEAVLLKPLAVRSLAK